MLVLPNQRLSWEFSMSDYSKPFRYRPHTQIIVLFFCQRKNIPSLELVPKRVLTELSQIAVPIEVLPKDDSTINFFRHVGHSLRSFVWSMIFVHHWRRVAPICQESELCFQGQKTIRSHKSRAGIPSNLNPASKEMIPDSVELCETEVCFLHIQLVGTYVWLPKTHNVPPEVDFESSRSWNSPNLHCFVVLPT